MFAGVTIEEFAPSRGDTLSEFLDLNHTGGVSPAIALRPASRHPIGTLRKAAR